MHIPRSWLLNLLRSHGSETTAQQAERDLPTDIDIERDRELLKKCGINPNVLEDMAGRDQELVARRGTI